MSRIAQIFHLDIKDIWWVMKETFEFRHKLVVIAIEGAISVTALGFEELFERHALDVYRYISRRHIGNDSQDLTSDVFIVALQKAESIPSGSELPWLYRTAWNVLANAHRKNDPIPAQFDLTEIEPDCADVVITNDQLSRSWQKLPQKDREVLRLAAWEGLSGKELATTLGISEGGAGAALSRARANLRKAWEEEN
jgi:RNA polymerase sigma-70 factor (ECF subfamily)